MILLQWCVLVMVVLSLLDVEGRLADDRRDILREDTRSGPINIVRSLAQACREETMRICPTEADKAECLGSKVRQIKDKTCKSWVLQREECMKGMEEAGCTDRVVGCIHTVPEEKVPPRCRLSDYYKSARMYRRRRGPKAPFTLSPAPSPPPSIEPSD
jgi:hypothetical protein